MWLVTCSLEFFVGPIILYGTFWVFHVAIIVTYCYLEQKRDVVDPFTKTEILWTPPTQRPPNLIEFRRH
jgi:hypothetical protein